MAAASTPNAQSGRGASDRLARLLALVPYLLARPGARVEDVAKAFGIDESRLIDDLQLLFVCGLPGHLPDDLIEASFEGGVIHLANADAIARPLRLGADEALALLVGLRALGEVPELVPGLSDRNALEQVVAKLERAAGDAAAGADSVTVAVETESLVVTVVRDALDRQRRLHLAYYVPGRDETTERDVDPMRLLVVDGRAYLEGWCRLVEDVRIFRLDRVVSIRELEIAAEVPPQATSRDVGAGLFQASPSDETVVLELEPAGRWVAEYYPCDSLEELEGGRLRITLRTPETAWVQRLALRLGGAGRVVTPASLALAVAQRADAALGAYADD